MADKTYHGVVKLLTPMNKVLESTKPLCRSIHFEESCHFSLNELFVILFYFIPKLLFTFSVGIVNQVFGILHAVEESGVVEELIPALN